MDLTYSAVALLIIVVATVVSLLTIDTRRTKTVHWLETVRQWQALLGSLLGFLSAAGVLVLGQSLQTTQNDQRTIESQHAIGFGLAIEAEQIAGGLRTGAEIGKMMKFSGLDVGKECQDYIDAITRAVPLATPVYDAVLSNLTEFGDTNLAVFVRFYAFHTGLLRQLPGQRELDCLDNSASTIRYLAGEMTSGLSLYQIIADEYQTIGGRTAGSSPAPSLEPTAKQ